LTFLLRGLLKEAGRIGHGQYPFGAADKTLLRHPFQEAAEVFRAHQDSKKLFALLARPGLLGKETDRLSIRNAPPDTFLTGNGASVKAEKPCLQIMMFKTLSL